MRLYDSAADMWRAILDKLNEHAERMEAPARRLVFALFWGSHHRSMRQLLTSFKASAHPSDPLSAQAAPRRARPGQHALSARAPMPPCERRHPPARSERPRLFAQVPTMIAKIEEALSAHLSVVVGLQLTGFAAAERAAQSRAAALDGEEAEDDEDVVVGASDAMLLFLKYAFEPADSGSGTCGKVPLRRAEYEAMQRAVHALRLPMGALDAIVLRFGHEHVAEITGRGARHVRLPNGQVEWQRRSHGAKKKERGALDERIAARACRRMLRAGGRLRPRGLVRTWRARLTVGGTAVRPLRCPPRSALRCSPPFRSARLGWAPYLAAAAFMAGEKRIAIVSAAGSTGISLHASLAPACRNRQRRLHIVTELPYSADAFVQQCGRTHRVNQACGPQYLVLVTDNKAEERFVAVSAHTRTAACAGETALAAAERAVSARCSSHSSLRASALTGARARCPPARHVRSHSRRPRRRWRAASCRSERSRAPTGAACSAQLSLTSMTSAPRRASGRRGARSRSCRCTSSSPRPAPQSTWRRTSRSARRAG